MKKTIIVLFLLALGVSPVLSQKKDKNNEDHEIIQQIRSSGLADILSFQNQNQGFSNTAFTQQVGNWNKSTVSQQSDAGSALSNQALSIQQGNSHEITVAQIGNGNLLLGFQSGYYSYELSRNQGNHYGFGLENGNGNGNGFANGHEHGENETFITGERNKLVIGQEGNNNGVLASQQGSDNSISAGQNGNNNYLLLLQKGNRNSISGYIQENLEISPNFDAIVQIGNDLSLSATDFSKSNGNSFRQEGDNLSLQINNQFANTLGGLEINQSGHDMKVVVDQSYFTLPMK